ncbi:MAG: hypothetical protein ACLTYW_07725 [Collinsella sp.]
MFDGIPSCWMGWRQGKRMAVATSAWRRVHRYGAMSWGFASSKPWLA